jgi:methyltransferase (TIGR00027 family)
MQEGRGSRTAERVAERRAAHQLLDTPRVFDDPLAVRIVRPDFDPKAGDTVIGRYLRTFLAVRSRVAEDRLAEAVKRGVKQYAIVGAGFDTFAYRNPFPDLRVFEVDHPDTQREKRERLAERRIDVPPSLTFVAADLATTPLGDALHGAGFDETQPSFFAWLGVVMYLERDAIDATLRFIASVHDTSVVFDYAVPPSQLGLAARIAVKALANRVAEIGEPWKTYFDPAELREHLQRIGFTSVDDLGPADIERAFGVKSGSGGHVVVATNT